ncbi:MAG: N-acetylmuramoyl-L-alanine amidase [Chloroflexi bacterium]|nr:N-acetylmuramoyl-L-alanine amidase [Chloroflexota bacterium]
MAASSGAGEVVPAPGSSSTVYEPNPGAIVVAIDPGHGGCLDWGVPDPQERGAAFSEKVMALAIGLELKRLLEEQGITVVMTRESDVALAGDDYPDLGCNGPPFRDVNGDGETGFDPEGKTRTHDELQARLDLVNLARADLLVSIHINSLTQNGVVFEIAATQTYYTDETPWGVSATQHLAQQVQDGVVGAMDRAAPYERQDRAISAVNFFIVAPPLFATTPDRPDPTKQPRRGALMPAVLTEVGSITLAAEHDLLLSSAGQAAAAQGIASGFDGYFANRPLAARFDALIPLGEAGLVPTAVGGSGPPFWGTGVRRAELSVGVPMRVTNTGTKPWPDDLRVIAGWELSTEPYLRQAPAALDDIGLDVPPLAPGESVVLVVKLDVPVSERGMLWITLGNGVASLDDLGSAPLQLSTEGP